MSNILKSTKLDIALVKPYFKTICFTLLLPIVFAAINRSLLTGVSFAMCFIAMTTGYTFSITEKNSMDIIKLVVAYRFCNGAEYIYTESGIFKQKRYLSFYHQVFPPK